MMLILKLYSFKKIYNINLVSTSPQTSGESMVMAPNTRTETLHDKQVYSKDENEKTDEWNCLDHILWFNVFWFIGLHIFAVYGLYLCLTEAKLATTAFGETTHL